MDLDIETALDLEQGLALLELITAGSRSNGSGVEVVRDRRPS